MSVFTTIEQLREQMTKKRQEDDQNVKNLREERERVNNAKLVAAHKSMVEAIYNAVVSAISSAMYRNPEANYAIVMNPHFGADYGDFNYLMILRGKYDRNTQTYSRLPHQTKLPIEEVFDMLKDRGVTSLTDISDRIKSFRIVYKVTF